MESLATDEKKGLRSGLERFYSRRAIVCHAMPCTHPQKDSKVPPEYLVPIVSCAAWTWGQPEPLPGPIGVHTQRGKKNDGKSLHVRVMEFTSPHVCTHRVGILTMLLFLLLLLASLR